MFHFRILRFKPHCGNRTRTGRGTHSSKLIFEFFLFTEKNFWGRMQLQKFGNIFRRPSEIEWHLPSKGKIELSNRNLWLHQVVHNF